MTKEAVIDARSQQLHTRPTRAVECLALACVMGCLAGCPAAEERPDASIDARDSSSDVASMPDVAERPDAGGLDAWSPSGCGDDGASWVPAADIGLIATPVPNAPRFGLFSPTGTRLRLAEASARGCVLCQSDGFGERCVRRACCTRPVCVTADGQELGVGDETLVDTCYRCRCDATGLSCTRRTDGECPANGCAYRTPDLDEPAVVPLGQDRLMSETSRCICEPDVGLTRCASIFPTCSDASGLERPERTRIAHPDGCSTCTCVNGMNALDWCDRRRC